RHGCAETALWPARDRGLADQAAGPVLRRVRTPAWHDPGRPAEDARRGRARLAQPLQDFAVYAQQDAPAPRYNDPYVDLQRGFVETAAARAHALSQGKGVDIAIVDTGVDQRHPELQGRIRDVHNLVDNDDGAFDADPHGTEVA